MSIKSLNFIIFLAFLLPSMTKAHPLKDGEFNTQHSDSISNNIKTDDLDLFDFIDQSLLLIFRFYQKYITDVDDHTCPMHPTCSNYGLIAIENYGFFIGSLKTIDRLHRCGHDLTFYKIIKLDSRNAHMDMP